MNPDLLNSIYDKADELLRHENTLMAELKYCEDRYSDYEEIASGGMKTVYNCRDSHTDRDVIMVCPKDPEMNEPFVREGRINAFLQHPNIMPVYDVGLRDENLPYFTMKHVHGQDLDEVLKKNFSLPEMIRSFIQVCEAIDYAHSLGIVHLDLKPANIRTGDFGEVVVCDWGISQLDIQINDKENSFLDKELDRLFKFIDKEQNQNTLQGTPGYIAPERYKKERVSTANDIYSLGAILYKILTGNTPTAYDHSSFFKVICPEKINDHYLPHSLVAICNKALHSKPEQRYRNMSEMLKDLNRYSLGYATAAENAGLMRQLRLLYSRNQGFCHLLFSSIILILFLSSYYFANISESRKVAIQEKERALSALAEIQVLNKNLEDKEAARQKLLKQEGKRQLFIATKMLAGGPPPGDLGTISGLRQAFSDDLVFAAAWIHYLAFDMVVGSLIAREAVHYRIPWPLRSLSLVCTFLLGPAGYLFYLGLRLRWRTAPDATPLAEFGS